MIKYFYDSFMALDTLSKIMAILGFALLTFTITVTILDYTSKAKHIDKKRW